MPNFDPLTYRYSSRRNVVYAKNGVCCTSVPLGAQVGLDVLKMAATPSMPPSPWPARCRCSSRRATALVRLFRARVDREGEKALRLERQRRCADGAERGRGSRKRLFRGARGRLAPHDGPGRARGLGGAQCALWHKAALRALRPRHFLRRKRLCRARQCRQALGARQQAHRQGHGAGPAPY